MLHFWGSRNSSKNAKRFHTLWIVSKLKIELSTSDQQNFHIRRCDRKYLIKQKTKTSIIMTQPETHLRGVPYRERFCMHAPHTAIRQGASPAYQQNGSDKMPTARRPIRRTLFCIRHVTRIQYFTVASDRDTII
jgi:hypothetical protein